MSYHARTILPPGASRKRKERESLYSNNNSSNATQAAAAPAAKLSAPARPAQAAAAAKEIGGEPTASPTPATATAAAAGASAANNRLLAGCMAFEFLTKGTLLGKKLEPARAEPKPEGKPNGKTVEDHGSYGEVASILKADGVHVPGILNPSQLARWIRM